uniref:Uncharacterized protein n=1 Tax=Tetraselmis sp. GSL018 TaxID=582737 RepID=A0A061RJB9_9CHLO
MVLALGLISLIGQLWAEGSRRGVPGGGARPVERLTPSLYVASVCASEWLMRTGFMAVQPLYSLQNSALGNRDQVKVGPFLLGIGTFPTPVTGHKEEEKSQE